MHIESVSSVCLQCFAIRMHTDIALGLLVIFPLESVIDLILHLLAHFVAMTILSIHHLPETAFFQNLTFLKTSTKILPCRHFFFIPKVLKSDIKILKIG